MAKDLEGKVALVTGAGSGIGHAIAQRFGREGASVVVNYFGYEHEAEQLASELSKSCERSIAVQADVSKSTDVRRMVEQAVKEFGRIDVLVNNAGIESSHPFLDIPDAVWDKTLAVDLRGPFICAQACGRVMRDHGGGSIVNISWMGNPDEVAQVALFLASDRSSYVTGSTYYVDGGLVRYAQAI
ncbi:MAG: SDR family oxidoreductase [Chloroflexi bacterium]|nr:MAG: SDR family oxidoreductase [Chloroflexota bacterium]